LFLREALGVGLGFWTGVGRSLPSPLVGCRGFVRFVRSWVLLQVGAGAGEEEEEEAGDLRGYELGQSMSWVVIVVEVVGHFGAVQVSRHFDKGGLCVVGMHLGERFSAAAP